MKKLYILLLTFFIASVSFGQRLANMKDTGVYIATKTDIGKQQTADYVITKLGSTIYATARKNSGLPDYSGSSFNTVITSAMSQLTNGGIVHISRGFYDNLDFITVPYSKIIIEGEGKYTTTLKLKASADASLSAFSAFVDFTDVSNCSIRNIGIDGNNANQTKIGLTAKLFGVRFASTTPSSVFGVIDNVYVHDCTVNGIQIHGANDVVIKNCHSKDNNWNNISVDGDRVTVDNCITSGCSDCSISVEGDDNRIINCNVGDMVNSAVGSVNSRWAIGVETQLRTSNRCAVIGNTVTGSNIKYGIRYEGVFAATDGLISNNIVSDMSFPDAVAVRVKDGSYFTISNNALVRCNGDNINLVTVTNSLISGNNVTQSTRNNAIILSSSSSSNKIFNNNLSAKFGITISSGCNNNILVGNTFSGNAATRDFSDAGTGNIYRTNYLGTDAKWIGADLSDTYKTFSLLGSSIKAQPITGNINNATSSATLNDQQIRYTVVYLPEKATITGVKWGQVIQGNYTANNYNGFALYSLNAGTLTFIDNTVNDGNTWKAGAATLNSKTWAGGTHVLDAGVYVIGLLYCRSAETTQPAILTYAAPANSVWEAADFTNSIKLNASQSAQTSMPSPTVAMSSLSAIGVNQFVALY